MRRIGQGFLQHALHFFDFFHQVQLRGQPPCGVGKHDVDLARLSGFHRVKTHRRAVAFGLRNHGNAVAFAPFLQLLAGGGAEGVARRQNHRFALRLEIFGELADGGGFARAVDARQHNHKRRAVFGDGERLFQRFEQVVHRVFQGLAQFVAVFEPFERHAVAHFAHQLLGGFNAHVAGEQHGFQLFVQVFVYLPAAEHACQRFGHVVARFGQALLQTACPAEFGFGFGFVCFRLPNRCGFGGG